MFTAITSALHKGAHRVRAGAWICIASALAFSPVTHPATAQAYDGMMYDGVPTPAIAQEDFPQPSLPENLTLPDEPQHPDSVIDYGSLRQRVVILHGMGRTSASMYKVAQAVRMAGYDDMNMGYDSTRDVLAKNIDSVYTRIRHFSDSDREVTHFICYSLGCLITRGLIEQHRPKNLGRVVMLGPPNQGSEMADYLQDHAIARWVLGVNLPNVGTRNRNRLRELIGDSADYELGIIAGGSAIDPISGRALGRPNDGRVPVEHTVLHGMKEHIVMDVNHTTLITNPQVIEQAITFIQTGHFSHDTHH